MAKRKVLMGVIVHRDGTRIRPAIGQIFDFTNEELEQIKRMNPDALGRPTMEVDVENEEARKAAGKEKADGDEKPKDIGKDKAPAKGKAKADGEDEV